MPVSIPPFNTVPAPNDPVQSAWAQQLTQYAVDHVNDAVDAHDASAISFAPTGAVASTNVQAAIAEIAGEGMQTGTPAGGVLAGTYPNPSFAADMATQAELNTAQSGLQTDINNTTSSLNAHTANINAHVRDGDRGDITVAGETWTIDPNAVTNAKLATIAQHRIKGRVTTGVGDPEDLSPAQARTMIASDSGGGTTNFLRADGTWAAPPSLAVGLVYADYTPALTGIGIGSGGFNQGTYVYIGGPNVGDVGHMTIHGYILLGTSPSVTGTFAIGMPPGFQVMRVTPLGGLNFLPVGRIAANDGGTRYEITLFSQDSQLVGRVLNSAGTYATWVQVNSTVPFSWGANDQIEWTATMAVKRI